MATEKPGLMSLCDELLLQVFGHCDGPTLESLAGTCTRLHRVVEDPRVWRRFDFSLRPMHAHQLQPRFRRLHHRTSTFHVRGRDETTRPADMTLTRRMLDTLGERCPQLRHMAISHANIHMCQPREMREQTLFEYPPTLETFAMRHVYVCSPCETLNFPPTMNNLHTIRIEYCPSFRLFQLFKFSRLKLLRHLSLRGCVNVEFQLDSELDCLLEFDSNGFDSTFLGFRQLQTLDLRETPVADNDIKCFNYTSSLRRLYLQAPSPQMQPRLAPGSPNVWRPARKYGNVDQITDWGISWFGDICMIFRRNNSLLERISLRGYARITDDTLKHLAACTPQLQRLDVRETAVTAAGVLAFRLHRPSCQLLTSLPAEAATAAATEAGPGPSKRAKTDAEATTTKEAPGVAAADHAVAGGSGTNQSRHRQNKDSEPEVWSDSDYGD